MEGEESRVFKSSDRTRENQDGREKDERCVRLADPKESQGCTKVLRIGKLLLPIYQRLCNHSQTIT